MASSTLANTNWTVPFNASANWDTGVYELPIKWSPGVFNDSTGGQCPLIWCRTYLSGCQRAPADPGLVRVSGESPFTMNFAQNLFQGYSFNLCVACSNGAEPVFMDNIRVTQPNRCASAYSTVPKVFSDTLTYNPSPGLKQAVLNQTDITQLFPISNSALKPFC